MISLHRLLLLVGITTGSVGPALADLSEALVNAVAGAFTPAQMSALIISARGNIKSGNDQLAQSLERLQPMLGVSGDVVLALLRILDRPDIPAEQAAQALADAVAQYHNLEDQLAQVTSEDSEGQHLVTQTQAATRAGRFSDAEALLGRFEEHEAALASSALNTVADPTSSTIHLIRAAQARTTLGHIALIELRYDKAIEGFQQAQQRLALVPAARPNSAGPQPGQSFSAWALVEQESKGGSPVGPDAVQSEPVSPSSAPATQSDTQLTAEGQSPLPQLDIAMPEEPTSMASSDQIDAEHGVGFPERSPTAIGLSTVATIQLRAATTATPRGVLEQPAGLSSTGAVSKDPSMGRSLSADTLALLLRRGDASLAVGDVSSARLLYERAAAEGDGPAATGAGKTYDPLFLSEIGALGTQGNWETAAAWYHRAIELGDQSAGDRLKQISSRSRNLAPVDAQPKPQPSPQSVPSKVSPVMSGRLSGTIGTGASLAASGPPVAPSDAGTVVARQAANVRDAPNNGSTILRTVPKGAVLRVYSRREGWIQSGDATAWGWVYSGLLEPVQ